MAFSFATSDVLIELDAAQQIAFITGAAEELIGMTPAQLLGKRFVDLVSSADRAHIADVLASLQPGRRMQQRTIGFVLGRTMIRLSGFKLPDDPQRIYLAGSRAISTIDPRTAATRDEQTGLLGRDDFSAMVEDQIRLLGTAGQAGALTLLQIEDLEGLQKRLDGRKASRLYAELGTLLRSYSRGGDSAGRLSEDKYGIVYDHTEVMAGMAAKLRELIKRADPAGDARFLERTIDLGDHTLNEREAVQAIRYAVNRFVETDAAKFDIASIETGIERLAGETAGRIEQLKRTINSQSFSLAFQPIASLADRTVVHHEALIRFRKDESPYEAIVFAEEVGIIEDLDLAVARKVRDFLWNESLTSPDLRIAVNLSARSLESDSFLEQLCEDNAGDADLRARLMFEVTESYKVRNLERMDNVIQSLRADGHLLCLDDFGGGGASFDYIQNVQVDYVKLDGTYVRRMIKNDRDAHILKAMADLCANLSVETIAEFVETEEQADRLRVIGIHYGQGYLFGRPSEEPAAQILRPASRAPLARARPATAASPDPAPAAPSAATNN
ncbi:MAG: EAL domain-containing protein [Alphaproteobacteria bacterium]